MSGPDSIETHYCDSGGFDFKGRDSREPCQLLSASISGMASLKNSWNDYMGWVGPVRPLYRGVLAIRIFTCCDHLLLDQNDTFCEKENFRKVGS
jgi:hypothetical protein